MIDTKIGSGIPGAHKNGRGGGDAKLLVPFTANYGPTFRVDLLILKLDQPPLTSLPRTGVLALTFQKPTFVTVEHGSQTQR